jgi:hypothetical protein
MNGEGTSGEGAASSCTPFITLLMTNCVMCCRASAPLPLSAAEALCSGGYHHCSLKYETIQQSTRGDVEKQTIYCPGRRLNKEEGKKEKSGFVSSSLDSSLDDTTTETGRKMETVNVV